MPLAFQSLNRGRVAFGFFNIETDMLLLDNHFMFADTFCRLVAEMARCKAPDDYRIRFEAYVIDKPEDVGDLMGAIHGVHYQGFIGAVYQRFPFPKTPEQFKQKADGSRTRPIVERIIASYAMNKELPFLFASRTSQITIGDYQFDRRSFGQLVRYVWDGGMPGWKNGLRPGYVTAMIEEVSRSKNPSFGAMSRNESE